MPARTFFMRQFFDLLRLYAEGLSVRQLAKSLGLPRSTVAESLAPAAGAGVAWPLPEGTDEATLLGRLFPAGERVTTRRPTPVWADVHAERKRPGVTLQLLWPEALPQGTSTPNYASTTGAGVPTLILSCGRRTRWARRSLWSGRTSRGNRLIRNRDALCRPLGSCR